MNNSELTSRIKSSLDIADIIGQTVALRKTSRGYMGLCPFHQERTPSFHVYTDSQSYYCFACHESGDIFTFLMKKEGLSFHEALEELARRAGIDTGGNVKKPSHSVNIYDLMSRAQGYFASCLKRSGSAMAYLKRRNITPEDAGTFGLGYAPASWDSLTLAMRRAGISDADIAASGLGIQSERGIYDRFRGRIVFPVKDIAGRVVAFGGRQIDGSGAKYLNSPESEIFRKRNSLYMLNIAGKYIREKRYSILCEGYMDALRLHQKGFHESVASLGTSLTEEQAGLLKRFADTCYICYDSDIAGKNAAIRGMYILAQKGLDVLLVDIPEGKDPDDYLSAHSPDEFAVLVRNAKPLILAHADILTPALHDRLRRRNALNELWEGISKLNPDYVLEYTGSLCTAMGVDPEELKRHIISGSKPDVPERITVRIEPVNDDVLEAAFCAMLMKYPRCRLEISPEEAHSLLQSQTAGDCAEAILTGNPEELRMLWLSLGDTGKTELLSQGDIFIAGVKGLEVKDLWERIKGGLEAKRIRRRMDEIRRHMNLNDITDEELKELPELQQMLQGLQI